MNEHENIEEAGWGRKATAAALIVVAGVVAFGVSMAGAAADTSVVDAATTGGGAMADTLKAIAMAMVPLAIGVFVAKRGWRIIKGFF